MSCVFFDSGTLKLVKWSGQFSVDCHRQFVILGLGKVRRPSGLSHNSGREGVGGGAWGEGGVRERKEQRGITNMTTNAFLNAAQNRYVDRIAVDSLYTMNGRVTRVITLISDGFLFTL